MSPLTFKRRKILFFIENVKIISWDLFNHFFKFKSLFLLYQHTLYENAICEYFNFKNGHNLQLFWV